MRSTSALLALLAFACTEHPPLEVAKVELARFQGGWYEIAKLPRPTQEGCTSTTASYRMKSATELDVYSECREGSFDGPVRSMAARAVVTDPSEPAKLSLDFGGFFGDYWIVDVDADYQLAAIGHPSRDYLWILSRTPSVEPSEYEAAVERVRKKDFDVTRLERTVQLEDLDGSRLPDPSLPSPSDHGCSLGVRRANAASLAWLLLVVAIGARLRARSRARPSRASSRSARWLLIGACALWSGSASASTIFPEAVTSHWGLEHDLPVPGKMGCRLCHTDEVGGAQNVRMPFGRLVREYYGVTKKNAGELEAALDDIRAQSWDSDGDGASDYDEVVIDATNPNDDGDHRPIELGEGGSGSSPVPKLAELPPPVGHGCSFDAQPSRRHSAPGLLLLVALFAAARRWQVRVR